MVSCLYPLLGDSSLFDYVESMKKIEYVIVARNIQWIYGSHNRIVPGTDLFFEAAAYLDDVQDGNFTVYTIEDGNRVYMKDEFIAVQLPQE